LDEALSEPFVFEPAEPITHGDTGLAGVPIDIGFGPGAGETKVATEVFDGLFVAVVAGLETKIHQDPVASPEGVMELPDRQPGGPVDFKVNHHLFAPECPAFVKDCVCEQPAPTPGMTVGGDELQMMPGVSFVSAGEA
jgi:hypothetical protein